MTDQREYELKFEIGTADVGRLLAHPELGASPQAKRHSSIYFDTPEGMLRRRRVSLRVRRSGGETIHTLKRRRGSLIDRDEWTRRGGELPDADWLRTTPLRSLFGEQVTSSLEPRFQVNVERSLFMVRHHGAEIEGALDQGTILADDARLPVNEFELELKSGQPKAVLDMARRLVTDLPLVLSLSGKAERGYAALERSWGRPTKAISVRLRRRMSLAEAFEAIVQACLHALTLNAALIDGDDAVAATHSTRIAVRHLRAVLKLFKPVLRRAPSVAMERELKWISARLGAARDADVFHTGVVGADPSSPGTAELAEVSRRQQLGARAQLLEAFASSRWRLLLVDLLAFSSEGVRHGHRDNPWRGFVRDRLVKQKKTLARRSNGLNQLDTQTLHDLRKSAKMLRYGFEVTVIKGLGKRENALVRDLQVLQQAIGDMHDQHAMREHLRSTFFDQGPPSGIRQDVCARASFAAGMLAARTVDHDGANLNRASAAAKRLRRR